MHDDTSHTDSQLAGVTTEEFIAGIHAAAAAWSAALEQAALGASAYAASIADALDAALPGIVEPWLRVRLAMILVERWRIPPRAAAWIALHYPRRLL